MTAPCGCDFPKIDRSPRGRKRAALDAARETGGDRDTVFQVLRFYGETYLESLDLSLWACRVAREEAEQKKAA